MSRRRLVNPPSTARWLALTAGLAMAMALAACVTDDVNPRLRLDRLDPLPTAAASAALPLRVAIAAVISPQSTVQNYQRLLDYMGERLGRPVELVQRRTYAEVNDLVRTGAVDMALVCTSAYVLGHDEFGMELLAAPVVKGESVYHSVVLVPADSAAQSVTDLAGGIFAFTDPLSNSGRVYPTYLVRQAGSTPEAFFGRTFFTYSHDDAIQAVASGLADGAAVDSLVYEYALEQDPALADRVREIHRSPPFGIPPAVVNPALRPQLKARLREVLLDMNDSAEGRAALAAAGIDQFTLADDGAYDSARSIVQSVGVLTP